MGLGSALRAAAARAARDPRGPRRLRTTRSKLRQLVGRGCVEATKVLEGLEELREGLAGIVGAGSEPGMGSAGDGADALKLARQLLTDSRVRRIAELAGRFKRILAAKRRQRVRHGFDELVDVEQGADLGRLLPTELGRLRSPAAKRLFYRDFLERNCLQYRMEGSDTLGKGPLVVCLDKSASMSGPKDVWSTAVAVALLDVAHREGRRFGLVCFNAGIIHESVVEVGGRLPTEALFVSCSGGTSIAAAVSRSLDIIQTRGAKLAKADIVLITDGISDATSAPALAERAKSLDASIMGFAIEMSASSLSPWCDRNVAVAAFETLDPQSLETV